MFNKIILILFFLFIIAAIILFFFKQPKIVLENWLTKIINPQRKNINYISNYLKQKTKWQNIKVNEEVEKQNQIKLIDILFLLQNKNHFSNLKKWKQYSMKINTISYHSNIFLWFQKYSGNIVKKQKQKKNYLKQMNWKKYWFL
jgi:hypothetical protein